MMNNWKTAGLAAAIVIVITIPLYVLFQLYADNNETTFDTVQFIGKERCIDCHKIEYDLWEKSDHKKAMEVATDSSVLGDFNNAKFISRGKETLFYKKDGKFFVKTEGVGGKIQDLEITHTFGYTPLQQYLIPFEDG